MALKCTNESCGYGPEWHRGETITRSALGHVEPSRRSDAYSQNAEAAAAGRPHFGGLCLNCLDDESRDLDMD